MGRDAPGMDYKSGSLQISIRAPRTGRDRIFTAILSTKADFNPRAPCGARRQTNCNIRPLDDFNPRAPCGARPAGAGRGRTAQQDFNPRAPCGARPRPLRLRHRLLDISILAPRAGRDLDLRPLRVAADISILAPRAGRDMRRTGRPRPEMHFNPRAPCGARHGADGRGHGAAGISILAPRAGRDPQGIDAFIASADFNPRAPCGARLVHFAVTGHGIAISILAPRAGRDCRRTSRMSDSPQFQSSRPVRGATRSVSFRGPVSKEFQSSRPVRGATAKMHKFSCIFCNKQPIEDRNPASGAGRQSHLSIHADRYACKTECEPAFNWLFTCRSHYIISVSSGK